MMRASLATCISISQRIRSGHSSGCAATAVRTMSAISASALGTPSTVLSIIDADSTPAPGIGEVKVSMKAAAVLVEDLRALNGTSLVSKGPGVMGVAGSGVATELGAGVTGVSAKETVLVVANGVWTDDVVVPTTAVFKAPSLSPEEAAGLPAFISAYAILNNYCSSPLKSGDLVVQTHGSGAVGAAISTLGKAMGLNVFSVSDADLGDARLPDTLKKKGAVKLAIVGSAGPHALNMVRSLAPGGCAVAYTAQVQSLAQLTPLSLPVSGMIFSDVAVAGFDFTAFAKSDLDGFQSAVNAVIGLVAEKKISLSPSNILPKSDFLKAFEEVSKKGTAPILKMA